MIQVVKDIDAANAITHGGVFHADEVFCTVILNKLASGMRVFRASSASDIPQDTSALYVYDIGFGKWDHHQKGGNGERNNGIPYAAAGLIWRDLGPDICYDTPDPKMVWKLIDRSLIQGIDAVDNGVMPRADYPAQAMSISEVIGSFHPVWDSNEDWDEAFLKACIFAESIFDNTFNFACSKVRAKDVIDEAIRTANGPVMVLEKFTPWQGYLLNPPKNLQEKAASITYVVYPSNRGGFVWTAVPDKLGGFGQRKPAPVEWKGLTGAALQEITGIKTATFVHPTGFMGGADSFADAIRLARIAASA